MWLKSKSIRKVNSNILNVFEPKFSIFAKQQYPSFSTSMQRNVATWHLWYANTFVDFFSHKNDQHFETGNITFKTVCCYSANSFFLDLISNELTFSHMTIVKGRKTCCWSFQYAWRKQISVLICCMTKKMPISSFSLFCC